MSAGTGPHAVGPAGAGRVALAPPPLTPLKIFQQIWTDLLAIPYIEVVNIPVDTDSLPDEWGGAILQPQGRSDVTLGSMPWVEEKGTIAIGLLTRSHLGPSVLDDTVDEVRSVFHGTALNGLHIDSVDGPHDIDPEVDGEWWRLGLTASYTFHSRRTTPGLPYSGWQGFPTTPQPPTPPDNGDNPMALAYLPSWFGAQPRTYDQRLMSAILLDDFAKGDGSDETDAFNNAMAAAIAEGKTLMGSPGKVYGLSGNVAVNNGFDLVDATVIQLSPNVFNRRTFYGANLVGPVRMRRVKIIRNGTPSDVSTLTDASTILLGGTPNGVLLAGLLLEDVEITGDGSGAALTITDAKAARVIRPNIHDMRWASPTDPGTLGENLTAIAMIRCDDGKVIEPQIDNLLGSINGGPFVPYNSNGVGFSGCNRCTVHGGTISRVFEAIDSSSGLGNSQIWILGTSFADIGAIAIKMLGNRNSGAKDCSIDGAGIMGIGINGTTSGIGSKHQRYENIMMRNIGHNHYWEGARGIAYLDNLIPDKSRDIVFQRCDVICDVASTTARLYGTTLDVYSVASGRVVRGQNVGPTSATTWAPSTVYAAGAFVQGVPNYPQTFMCLVPHTSGLVGTFGADFTSGKWTIIYIAGAVPPASWANSTDYTAGTSYVQSGQDVRGAATYIAATSHKSIASPGTFATDLAAGKWVAVSRWTLNLPTPPWQPSTTSPARSQTYAVDAYVHATHAFVDYRCLVAHTASANPDGQAGFDSDLAAGYWTLATRPVPQIVDTGQVSVAHISNMVYARQMDPGTEERVQFIDCYSEGWNTAPWNSNPSSATQPTSKSDPLTLNRLTGFLQLHPETVAPGDFRMFFFNNSQLAFTDWLDVQITDHSTGACYVVEAYPSTSGGFARIYLRNIMPVPLSDALTLRFRIDKNDER